MTTGDLLKRTRLNQHVEKTMLGEQVRKKTRLKNAEQTDEENLEDTSAKLIAKGEKQPQANDASVDEPHLEAHYQVLGVIGKGGMGSVYKVYDRELDKILALKVLQPELANDQAALRRFEQEAEAASQLNHENLISVLGHGKTIDGAPYLVMEYFSGESLAALIKRNGALEPARALNIFKQLSEALIHAHAQGIIHRDVKPANVILSQTEGGLEVARIVDFGIAKILPVSNRETHNLTETRQVFGSPHYMSPEHCLGFKMDERSDIYSLGCLMYEVLTGNPPFALSDVIQVVIKHINEEAKPFPRDHTADPLAQRLEGVVLKCLEKEQTDRYQSVSELLKDIEIIQAGKAPPKFHRRKSAKLEYTSSQIFRAILGTFLLFIYIAFALGWFDLESGNYLTGTGMLVICLTGSCLFGSSSLDALKRLKDGRLSLSDCWNLSLVTSLAAMCLSFLPMAVELAAVTFTVPFHCPDWYSDFCSLCSLAHIYSIASVVIALVGGTLFRGARMVRPHTVALQYWAIALVLILSATSLFPRSSSQFAWFLSGNQIVKKYSPGTSESLLQIALQLDPLNQKALFDLIDRKTTQGRSDDVDQLYSDYFRKETVPKQLAAAHFKRSSLYEMSSWQRMLEVSKAIKCLPRSDYYEHRAWLHVSRSEYNDALKDFDEAIRSNPNTPNAYLGRAQIFAATGNYQTAALELDRIASQRAGWANVDVFFMRALLLEKLNNADQAKHDFNTVAALVRGEDEPSAADAYKAAYSYTRLGELDLAAEILQIAGNESKLTKEQFDSRYKNMNLPLDWKPLE